MVRQIELLLESLASWHGVMSVPEVRMVFTDMVTSYTWHGQ